MLPVLGALRSKKKMFLGSVSGRRHRTPLHKLDMLSGSRICRHITTSFPIMQRTLPLPPPDFKSCTALTARTTAQPTIHYYNMFRSFAIAALLTTSSAFSPSAVSSFHTETCNSIKNAIGTTNAFDESNLHHEYLLPIVGTSIYSLCHVNGCKG